MNTDINSFFSKYNPSLVYFDVKSIIDTDKGNIVLNSALIDALVMAKNTPLIFTENDFSVIFYQTDLVERDLNYFISYSLLIKIIQPVSIPDNRFISQSGAKIRVENGFLKIHKEGYIKTFSAAVMKESVKTRREKMRA